VVNILDLIILSLFGVVVGIGMGLLPGMHKNNVISLILPLSIFFASPYNLVVFLISVLITHIFISYIPSIFLGAPEENTSLSVLPGHRLLLEGRGYEAIKLTIIGGIGSLLISLIIIALLANTFGYLNEISRPYIQYVIIGVVIFMLVSEKKLRKILSATLIVLLSGIFGVIVLGSSIVKPQNVLFPVLSGMFGLSTIIMSMSKGSKIPEQKKDSDLKITKWQLIKSCLIGSVAGVVAGFLPSIGVSQTATMVKFIGGMRESRSFLVTLSGINLSNEVFGLISLFLVNSTRSGASIAIQGILTQINFYDALLLVGITCFVSGIAALLTMFLGKRIANFLSKLNYKYLSLFGMTFLLVMIFILTGVYGLLIAFTSTSIGLLCAFLNIRRSHCMGCLLIPSVLFFSGLNGVVLSILGI
jgi:putative membrane protein